MSLTSRPHRAGAWLMALAAATSLALIAALVPAAGAVAGADSGPSPAGVAGELRQRPLWWVGEWLEAFDRNGNKIDDHAEALAARKIARGRPDATLSVLVTFWTRPDRAEFLQRIGATDAYFFRTQPVVDLELAAADLEKLSKLTEVAAVELDYAMTPMLNVGAPAIQANRGAGANTHYNGATAEDLGYTGQDMTVAVLDTGVQDQHGAFTGKWIAGTDVSPQTPPGIACFNPPDDVGHGTHVASTAIGTQPADNLHGTAKAARLVEVKIAIGGATAGIGPVSIGSAERGFEFVKLYNDRLAAGNPLCGPNDDHIDVATLSFGSLGRGGPNAGSAEGFIDSLVGSGVAVTIAVGNCGPQASSTCTFSDTQNGISSPGNAAGAIGVAAFDDRGTVDRANDVIAGFSSRGPNQGHGASGAADLEDRYRKPDVAAPGVNIQAAGPVPFTLSTQSGTSMATPHVAGVAALLLEAGEKVKSQTGDVNLMASTSNGFSNNDYVSGAYPVRDALVNATDYKSAGSVATWTGPNGLGRQWNNAWGYGQVNAFDALCWAWANVLGPGGATPPAPVADNCEGSDPDPDPTSSPTESPSCPPTLQSGAASMSGIAATDAAAVGEGTTYFLHSVTGSNAADKLSSGHTFDSSTPTFTDDALATDVPAAGNGNPGAVWDPSWIGSVSGPIEELTLDFWAKVPEEEAQTGGVTWRVSLWNGATEIVLPNAEMTGFDPTGPTRFRHTYTTMLSNPADQSSQVPLSVTPDGTLGIQIRPWFAVNSVGATIFYDSVGRPSSFTVAGGSSDPTPEPTPTTDPTSSPDPCPTDSPTPTPTDSPTGTPSPSDTPTPTPTSSAATRNSYPEVPDDPYFGEDPANPVDLDATQWAPRKIRAPQAWQEVQATGAGVKVAVIDSGLDLGHPDFDCPGKVSVVAGSDAVRDGNGPQDVDGHGTHVAGIIGACTNNGVGIAGVAPDSTIMPIQVFSSDANYDGDGDNNGQDDLADAIRLAADSGAHVINMSLSFGIAPVPGTGLLGSQYEYTNFRTIPAGIREAIKYAQEAGVVVVAAAGNDTTLPICDYPAVAKDVICVGATDPRDVRTWYTNGANKPQTNGSFGPAVVAPGGTEALFCDLHAEHILSTYSRAHDGCDEGLEGYRTLNGTSMASPHVAGVAALVYDRLAGERNADNALTVIDAITSSAVDLGTPGYDPVYAFGRVDALAAVRAIDVAVEPVVLGTSVTYTGDAGGQHSDEVTLAATLVDENGVPVEGAELTFELVGENGSRSFSASTGPDGVATTTEKLDDAPGQYQLTVRFAGEEDVYEPSADSSAFVIDHEDSSVSLTVGEVTGKGKDQKRRLDATLVDADSGDPVIDREVEFLCDGSSLGTAHTGSDGVATVMTPHNCARGDHTYEVTFEGDDYYLGASDNRRSKPGPG